jgi:hypothetical protein
MPNPTGFDIDAAILALMPVGGGNIPTVAQIAAGMPPFVAQGASPGCYNALVAAIVAALPALALPTGAESSLAQSVTSGAGANTKGAWVQMIAATGKAVLGLVVGVAMAGFGTTGTFDVGLGASGSEVATFKDLPLNAGSVSTACTINFSCSIPIGTRISIRAADSTGGETYHFVLNCLE